MSEGLSNKLINAYDRMLMRGREALDKGTYTLGLGIEKAMEKASELGELSREEAIEVGDYLKRDLQDAAEFIERNGSELRDWLRFDVNVVEQSLADAFSQMVDQTRVELDKLEQRATALGEWHTGEVVGIGTLECKGCGEQLHFHHTAHIPPCPKCRGSKFRRISSND